MAIPDRRIRLTVRLAPQTGTGQPTSFADAPGNDSVTISGLRTSAIIHNSGAPADCRAVVRVWGMPPSLMNQLTTLGLVFNLVPKNTITVEAGTSEQDMSAVFAGTIYGAWGDYGSQPQVPFVFDCLAGVADAVIPAPPQSFTGATDVATIMSGIARLMNVGFENNGVDVKLSAPYFYGSAMTMARTVARHANIEWGIIDSKLCIWPKGGNRNTPDVPVISPDTGMISYPSFTQQGIIVRTLFNPRISFGSLVEVRSSLLDAISATAPSTSKFPTRWAVNKMDLALDALLPKGQWMQTIYGYDPGYARAIIPPP